MGESDVYGLVIDCVRSWITWVTFIPPVMQSNAYIFVMISIYQARKGKSMTGSASKR